MKQNKRKVVIKNLWKYLNKSHCHVFNKLIKKNKKVERHS